MNELIDIEGYQKEQQLMDKEIKILRNRFMALAMDYQYYKNKSFMQKDIYKLRDEVHYRLKSVRVQVRVLFKHQQLINNHLNDVYKNKREEVIGDYWPSNPLFDQAQEEVSCLFDSFIYHLTSIFDYIGNLTNFIFGNNPQQSVSWNSLARSERNSKSGLGQKSFAATIKEVNSQFVNKLYKHRSILIHERSDIFGCRKYITEKEGTFFCKFISTQRFNKHFSELRKLGKEKFITIEYAIFWLFKQTSKYINQVLFALKKELELNPDPMNSPKFIMTTPTGKITSPSEVYSGKEWTSLNMKKIKIKRKNNSHIKANHKFASR